MLLTKRWRQATLAAVGFGATIALGFIVIPSQAWEYWTKLAFDPNRVGSPAYTGNQSLNGTVLRLLGPEAPQFVWLICAVAVLVAGLWVSVRLWSASRLCSLSAVALTGLLVSPISWSHHWVWMLPASVCLWGLYIRARAALLPTLAWFCISAAGMLLLVGAIFPIWWVPLDGNQGYELGLLLQPPASAYVLAGIFALTVLLAASQQKAKLFDSIST